MSRVADAIDQARAELAANPRLRLGVWAIVAILAGYFAFVVQADRVDAASAAFASADATLTRGRDLLDRQDWPERLAASRAVEADLQDRFWQAPNEGLAQANLRAAVEELTAGLYLGRPRIDLGASRPVPNAPGLWQVQARFVAQVGGSPVLRLLHRLASHPKKLVVERLDMTRRQEALRVEMLLSGYFLLDGPPDPDDGEG
ncbi:MAG: hypothetical protein OXU77_19785 [Gammaproteobacteria bacterium]|nr:hypothetical protein [Gammaproteobacteria bacterium]MDE0441406.1 hypothetical protein [Gammaproteobacteria bacterium]